MFQNLPKEDRDKSFCNLYQYIKECCACLACIVSNCELDNLGEANSINITGDRVEGWIESCEYYSNRDYLSRMGSF